jgi:translation elongation factor EF-Tu-like GTPase
MSFSAKVTFLGKDKGGRTNPPMAGYKPHLRVGDEYTSCIIKPKNKDIEIMTFGTEYLVDLELRICGTSINK